MTQQQSEDVKAETTHNDDDDCEVQVFTDTQELVEEEVSDKQARAKLVFDDEDDGDSETICEIEKEDEETKESGN